MQKKTSAVCRLDWNARRISWQVERFRAVKPERTNTILSVAGEIPLLCAAFDGPLRRGFDVIGRYRTAERMLTRKLQSKMGKPGQSSTRVGKNLNAAANACAGLVLQHCTLAPATHDVQIDDHAVVEAFPSSFLGALIEAPWTLGARRRDRSDCFFRHWCKHSIFDRLVARLLPGRQLPDPSVITNHDDRAALVCALTALCVVRNDYTAVGDDDGWIILPPSALIEPWAQQLLQVNASEEPTPSTSLYCSVPGETF